MLSTFGRPAIAAAFAIRAIATASHAATRHVPADHSTIQACIDAAVDGDECVVAPGTYHETINFLGKAITVRGSGGRDVTTIDATGLGGSVVTCANGERRDMVLDGFTLTGGTGTSHRRSLVGGGMFSFRASPTVRKCRFNRNSSGVGGGLFNDGGDTLVEHCEFIANVATDGGAVYNLLGGPTLSNCAFHGNQSVDAGGAIYNFSSLARTTDSTFVGNTSSLGGALFNDGTYFASIRLPIKNCTFVGNRSQAGGAIYNFFLSHHESTGCVFWQNSPDQIRNDLTSEPVLRFTAIQDGLPPGAVDGGGNIFVDPLFRRESSDGGDGWGDDPATPVVNEGANDDHGDLRLQPGSPCINAGDPDVVPPPGDTDLDGHARVLCGRVDMGAYEFGIGDYDCDQAVDLADFRSWQDCMTGPQHDGSYDGGCAAFDFDADADVDLDDFRGFQLVLEP